MRGLEADDDIAGLLPSLDVPVCLDNLLQGRGSVDDSLELSGPEQLGQLPHRLLVVVRNGEQDLLAARQGGNEGQERILGQRTNSGEMSIPPGFSRGLQSLKEVLPAQSRTASKLCRSVVKSTAVSSMTLSAPSPGSQTWSSQRSWRAR